MAPRVRAEDPSSELRRGVEVRRFRYPSRGRRLKEIGNPPAWVLGAYVASAFWAVGREIRRWRPDVILGHWVLPVGPVVALASSLYRRPCVLVAHGSDVYRYAARSRALRAAARFALRRARRVIAVSEALARLIVEQLGVREESVRVVPMGVDEDVFAPAAPSSEGIPGRDEIRKALLIDPGSVLMLFVGDLVVEKGLREALEAVGALRAEGHPVTLGVIGDGPLRNEVERVGASRESGVRYLGRQPPRVVADWYQASDLLVLPSHGEGSPVVVMEALTCGLPVVATRVGGIPELVEDGRAGRLVEPRSASSLTAALRDVLAPQRLAGMRSAAETAAGRYGARARAQAVLQTLAECLPPRTSAAKRPVPDPGGTDV